MIQYEIQPFDDVTFNTQKFQSVKPDEMYFDLQGGYIPPYMNHMGYTMYLYGENFSDSLVFHLYKYPEIGYPGVWGEILQTEIPNIEALVFHDIRRINDISEIV